MVHLVAQVSAYLQTCPLLDLDQSQGARVLCSSNREACHEKDEHHWNIGANINHELQTFLVGLQSESLGRFFQHVVRVEFRGVDIQLPSLDL